MIRKINDHTVKELAAAQVILDLAAAVKELVENSIDANATQIVVNFVNSGLEAIEVSDDGSGISPDDMRLLGERHHTSKITTEDDVFEVKTFGFRGEALHSLAALSIQLTITSQTSDSGTGFKASLNGNEPLLRLACPRGTTVKITGLLTTLPVRRAEWQRNSKQHLARALWLLQSYVLAVPAIRIRCTGIVNGKATAYFASSGSDDISKSYAEVFKGELKSSFRLVKSENDNFCCALYFTTDGRRTADRQFLFVNNRPCDLPRLSRKLNETFKAHSNSTSFPIFILHITTSAKIDANLTPDKRQLKIPFEDDLIRITSADLDKALTKQTEIPVAPLSLSNFTCSPNDPTPMSIKARTDSQECTHCADGDSSLQIQSPAAHCTDVGSSFQIQPPVNSSQAQPPASLSRSRPLMNLPRAQLLVELPLDNNVSAQVLERSDFGKMEILGQFNNGFILTKLRTKSEKIHIFIIDQHASDERHRLEGLQRDLAFTCQTMLIPKRMNLGLDDTMFIIDNEQILGNYGFTVRVLEEFTDQGIEQSAKQSMERVVLLLTAPFVMGLQLAESGIESHWW